MMRMGNLEFALWDAMPHGTTGTGFADELDEHIRLAERVEELGWHSYFIIEHQNAHQGSSAPTIYLTAVARATSRLRIGAMMWQLPFYHPIRLAQDIATLDHLSRGRVEFGTGKGVHEHEFLRWNVDYYARAEMTDEVLEIVKRAWTDTEVTYSGKFFTFDEALPHPKPYQNPYPPIWYAVHSDESVEYAARHNYHMAKNLDTDSVVEGKFELYRRIWRECQHAGPMPRMFLMRPVHVAPTDEQAHAQAREFLLTGAERTGGGPIADTRVGWGSNSRGMGRDSELPHNKARGATMAESARNYDFTIENGLALVGSPETVIRRLQQGQARMGYDIFCTNHHIGKMPPEMVAQSIELFGREVIPAFAPVGAGAR